MALLEEIFEEFCNYLDGKLKWTGHRRKFTNTVLGFFSALAEKKESVGGKGEYCRIDYVWRSNTNSHHIVLAVEHENKGKIDEFLEKEIRHLIDFKAENKIAITYPALGDESDLLKRICNKIKKNSLRLSTLENYLIVLGFSTTKIKNGRRRRAILFKAYYIGQDGEILNEEERLIFQGRKTLLVIGAIDDAGRELRVPFRLERVR